MSALSDAAGQAWPPFALVAGLLAVGATTVTTITRDVRSISVDEIDLGAQRRNLFATSSYFGDAIVARNASGQTLIVGSSQAAGAVVLLDAMPRGLAPGTLSVLEPDLDGLEASVDAHGMDPVAVLGLARVLGGELPRVLVVGCEPLDVMRGDEEDVVATVSEPVRAALDEGVALVETLLEELQSEGQPKEGTP